MRREELGMDKLTQRWMIGHAARNYWRVASFIDLEDLIQDGHMVFWRVRRKYLGKRSGAYIVNTFKASFINHIHDLATARSRAPLELHFFDNLLTEENARDADRMMPIEPEVQTFLASLAAAPFRIREALAVFASEEGRERLRRPYRLRADGTRETVNERLCRIAGFDPQRVDLSTSLREFLTD